MKVIKLTSIALVTLPLVTSGLTTIPDTVASVQLEIDLLNSRLNNIFYPNYNKFLKRAFHPQQSPVYGLHVTGRVKDDVLKFHDIPKDKYVTSFMACTGTDASGAPYVKGIKAMVDSLTLNEIGDLTGARGTDCITWVLADSGNLSLNFKVTYSKDQVNSIQFS